MARCHYSGLFVLSCKVSDLCDCFDYPDVEARVAEILARRDAATERPTPADPRRVRAAGARAAGARDDRPDRDGKCGMSLTTITETCGCGASFTTSANYPSDTRKAADEWRASHKHAESVGICGETSPWIGPEGFYHPHCVLKAGHAGSHGDGEGSHWGNVVRPKPRPRIPLTRRRA